MPQASPQQMPHSEGQGKPQGLGIPYYLYLSLLPTPVPNNSSFVSNSLAGARAANSPSPVESGDVMMPLREGWAA